MTLARWNQQAWSEYLANRRRERWSILEAFESRCQAWLADIDAASQDIDA